MSITSELRSTDGTNIPLLGVEVTGEVLGGIARTVVRQRYKNREKKPIEAVYTFPLPSESTLVGFSMTCAGRTMKGVVKEREQAFLEYDDAIHEGHGAALVDEERRNVFTASVGNLLPEEETVIEIELLERLTADEGALRWMLPTLVAPRYMPGAPSGDRTAHGSADPTTRVPDADRISPPIGAVDYGILIDVRFMLGENLTVESPSHVISSEKIQGGVRVKFASKEVALDRDVVITARGGEASTTSYVAHKVAGTLGYVAITVVPDLFSFAKSDRKQRVVFVVDISGSMAGASIDQARAALRLCLRQLREGDLFNVIAFDHQFTSFQVDLVPFTQRTLDAADRWVSSLETNGGTEMLAPLVAGAQMAQGGVLVLLTDGQVGNEAEILERVLENSNGARLYTFGIGTNVSEMLLRDLGKRTGGACEFIYPGERIDDKVIAQFARATAPRVDHLDVKTPGLELSEMAPSTSSSLVDGEPWTVFARYEKSSDGAVELRGKIDGEAFFLRVAVSLPDVSENVAVAKLWARERIRELEGASVSGRRADANKARILALALEHQLASSVTSMIVVETREGDRRTQGVPNTRVVPVNSPHGWAMLNKPRQAPMMAMRAMALGAGTPPPQGGAMPMPRSAPSPASIGAPKRSPAAPAPPGAAPPPFATPPPFAAHRRAEKKKDDVVSRVIDFLSFSKGDKASADLDGEAAQPMSPMPSDPAGILSRQLASGLWAGDDGGIEASVRATALALLTLNKAGINTAHAMYGAQLKKAISALVTAADALSDKTLAELALSASWLVASGARSRAQVVEVAKKYGITFADETSVRAQAEALAS